jgi:hypothetical protein
MKAAEDAVSQAKNSEAEKYAKAQFDQASGELEKARQHMSAQEYTEAKAAADNTIKLAQEAVNEVNVQRELMKNEVEQNLAAFMNRWKEVSTSIEKSRGKDAKALAAEAAGYAKTLTEQLNNLKSNQQWAELKMALEEANKKADEYAQRVGGN